MTVLSMPTDGDVLGLVCEGVAVVLERSADGLTGATRLVDELNADSLAVIEIVEVVEERLRGLGHQVWVDDATLARLQTLSDLTAALSAALRGSQA